MGKYGSQVSHKLAGLPTVLANHYSSYKCSF